MYGHYGDNAIQVHYSVGPLFRKSTIQTASDPDPKSLTLILTLNPNFNPIANPDPNTNSDPNRVLH